MPWGRRLSEGGSELQTQECALKVSNIEIHPGRAEGKTLLDETIQTKWISEPAVKRRHITCLEVIKIFKNRIAIYL